MNIKYKENLGERIDNSKFLGGTPNRISKWIVPNITPDCATGIGDWTNQNLLTFLTMGMLPDGDFVGGTMADVSEKLSGLTVGYTEAMAL
jgi:hypothetical protein